MFLISSDILRCGWPSIRFWIATSDRHFESRVRQGHNAGMIRNCPSWPPAKEVQCRHHSLARLPGKPVVPWSRLDIDPQAFPGFDIPFATLSWSGDNNCFFSTQTRQDILGEISRPPTANIGSWIRFYERMWICEQSVAVAPCQATKPPSPAGGSAGSSAAFAEKDPVSSISNASQQDAGNMIP